MVVGPEKPTRAAQRLVGQTVTAGSSLLERKDRLVEDVRILGVVLGTAFEGRIERVNERVEDYQPPARPAPAPRRRETPKGAAEPRALPVAPRPGFRTGPGAGA